MKIYNDIFVNDYTFIRGFCNETDETELKWHYDEQDRVIESVSQTDWLFQFDNELPISLNQPIAIKKGIIHRLIKGSGDLQLKIVIK
jgi:hypothetical protein